MPFTFLAIKSSSIDTASVTRTSLITSHRNGSGTVVDRYCETLKHVLEIRKTPEYDALGKTCSLSTYKISFNFGA
jgi:hypothetical protein